MGGTGCVVLLCMGQGDNQAVQCLRLPQTTPGCAEAGAAEGQA